MLNDDFYFVEYEVRIAFRVALPRIGSLQAIQDVVYRMGDAAVQAAGPLNASAHRGTSSWSQVCEGEGDAR